MNLYEKLINKQEKLSVIGLGYVGLPLAVAFSRKIEVIGFDINVEKLNEYKNGIDVTGEVSNDELKKCPVFFTNDINKLKEAKFHVVAVPTPINSDKTPDLRPVMGASKTVGQALTKGAIVVYESTVYPGLTEEICIPILERESGLKFGIDFTVGYSPERISPADKVHKLETIVKIVSGSDGETLDTVAKTYELVALAGVHRAQSIKVAEAAKVIENCQRDINIAFMNELSIIFNKMDIDTKAVLKAAGTKWNFLNFTPGLVGGHCIGVDPYYLTYKAEDIGYHSQIILAGRKINDDMGKYVAENTIKKLLATNVDMRNARVGILGFTFKENCPDTRNTKVMDIINELKEYGIEPLVVDPVANVKEAEEEYGLHLHEISSFTDLDCLIIAVAHSDFLEFTMKDYEKMLRNRLIIDVKGLLDKREYIDNNFTYWRL